MLCKYNWVNTFYAYSYFKYKNNYKINRNSCLVFEKYSIQAKLEHYWNT